MLRMSLKKHIDTIFTHCTLTWAAGNTVIL